MENEHQDLLHSDRTRGKPERLFLDVPFKAKEAAKSLGAKWDSDKRRWYVPEGRNQLDFAVWLEGDRKEKSSHDTLDHPDPFLSPSLGSTSNFPSSNAPPSEPRSRLDFQALDKTINQNPDQKLTQTLDLLDPPAKKTAMSLSSLLAGVTQAVTQAFRNGAWTIVEVVELRVSSGHVYLGLSERGSDGLVLAKASATIWRSTANTILPRFEAATGAKLAPGIKILVRAKPVFKAQYGLNIEIDAIDPEYTLGDLEAKKRAIREQLRAEGLYDRNRELDEPWDFNSVLVIAPEGGAGLGDFQAEANRLEHFGLCRFTYAYSSFQGEGAAGDIKRTMQRALKQWVAADKEDPDAIVIIRGGGAVNDMAWLNDYELVKFVCNLPIPVLTGIGHERDSTILDEVANIKFDTPSKVVGGIEHVIVKRSMKARDYFSAVKHLATKSIQDSKTTSLAMHTSIKSDAVNCLSHFSQTASTLFNEISIDSMRTIRGTSDSTRDAIEMIREHSLHQMASVKANAPSLWLEIALNTRHALKSAKSQAQSALDVVAGSARGVIKDASIGSKSLMLEITGQGPEKTLNRGFVIVRDKSGTPLTRAINSLTEKQVEIEFGDGVVSALISGKIKKRK